MQPHALAMSHFDGILRKHLRQMAACLSGDRERCGHYCYRLSLWNPASCAVVIALFPYQVQPGAGAVRPVVSARPSRRFIHCTAPPAAPLLRLSTTDMTAMELPLVTAPKCA